MLHHSGPYTILHIPYCEDVAGSVRVAKLAVEIQLLLHHQQFLQLNWIAYNFLAQVRHQMLLHWPYLSDLKKTTHIELIGSFPWGLSVYVSDEDYILLFVAISRVNITLISQPSTLIRQQKLFRSRCLCPEHTDTRHDYSLFTWRKLWETSHVSSVS